MCAVLTSMRSCSVSPPFLISRCVFYLCRSLSDLLTTVYLDFIFFFTCLFGYLYFPHPSSLSSCRFVYLQFSLSSCGPRTCKRLAIRFPTNRRQVSGGKWSEVGGEQTPHCSPGSCVDSVFISQPIRDRDRIPLMGSEEYMYCTYFCYFSLSLPAASAMLQVFPGGPEWSESYSCWAQPLCWGGGPLLPWHQQTAFRSFRKIQWGLWWVPGCRHRDGWAHTGTVVLQLRWH